VTELLGATGSASDSQTDSIRHRTRYPLARSIHSVAVSAREIGRNEMAMWTKRSPASYNSGMSIDIDATYRDGAIHPDQPLNLPTEQHAGSRRGRP
jgi:hypothetical protein